MRAGEGETSPLAHEETTLAAARAVLERSEANGWSVAVSPKRLRIQTLDAFCASVARSLPLTSGMGGQPAIVQDAAATAIYRRAALATLDWLIDDASVSSAVERVLSHLDNDSAAYVESIADMLSKRDQWLAIVGSGNVKDPDALRATLESGIERVVQQHLADLRARFTAVLPPEAMPLAAYAGSNVRLAGRADSPVAALEGLDTLPGTQTEDFGAWCGLAELVLTKSGKWRRTVNDSLGFPRSDNGEKEAWLRLLENLPEDRALRDDFNALRELPATTYPDAQWEVLLALLEVLPTAVFELKRLFGQDGVCDFAEVALCAEAALASGDEPGQAALLLDQRLSHLLVDEMQDTSVSQYRLLEALVAGWVPDDGRTFFCVGDPMQSIYRFRNAEVGQFVRLQSGGLVDVSLASLTLRRNFRSVDTLVHWFNDVFSAVFPRQVDLAAGAVSYSPSTPVPGQKGGELDGYFLHPVFDGSQEDEANATAVGARGAVEARQRRRGRGTGPRSGAARRAADGLARARRTVRRGRDRSTDRSAGDHRCPGANTGVPASRRQGRLAGGTAGTVGRLAVGRSSRAGSMTSQRPRCGNSSTIRNACGCSQQRRSEPSATRSRYSAARCSGRASRRLRDTRRNHLVSPRRPRLLEHPAGARERVPILRGH